MASVTRCLRRAEQDALLSALGNAVLKVYTETGHSPQWERPEQFVGDLEAFLDHAGARERRDAA